MGGMTVLTLRERDVVRLVAEGMRNQEVAFKLNLYEHTVRNYMLRIFDKLAYQAAQSWFFTPLPAWTETQLR